MDNFRKNIRGKYFFAFLTSLAIALVLNLNIQYETKETTEIKKFQAVVLEKLNITEDYIALLSKNIETGNIEDLMASPDLIPASFFEDEGIVFLGYVNDTLKYWSDNLVPIQNVKPKDTIFHSLVQLENGWYVSKSKQINNIKFVGLILIKNQYSFSNDFIKNNFHETYGLPSDYSVTDNPDDGYGIKDNNGNYLFSLLLKSKYGYNKTYIILSSVFYLLALLFIFGFIYSVIFKIDSIKKRRIVLFVFSGFLIGIRFLMLNYKLPSV